MEYFPSIQRLWHFFEHSFKRSRVPDMCFLFTETKPNQVTCKKIPFPRCFSSCQGCYLDRFFRIKFTISVAPSDSMCFRVSLCRWICLLSYFSLSHSRPRKVLPRGLVSALCPRLQGFIGCWTRPDLPDYLRLEPCAVPENCVNWEQFCILGLICSILVETE